MLVHPNGQNNIVFSVFSIIFFSPGAGWSCFFRFSTAGSPHYSSLGKSPTRLAPSPEEGRKLSFSYLCPASLQGSRHNFACVPFTSCCHAFTFPALLLLLGHDDGFLELEGVEFFDATARRLLRRVM